MTRAIAYWEQKQAAENLWQFALSDTGYRIGEIEAAGRDLALRLLDTYVENLQPDLAEQQLQHIRDAGIDKIRFA
ncbi:MAG: hypothetical protein J7647_03135 [Cyanobacteria bacterium SBLK]|nr:hypothetical protein [Cyanobacteria bacterium SBLK]